MPPTTLVNAFERVLFASNVDVVVGSGFGPGIGPAPLRDGLVFQYWSKGFNGGLFTLFGAIALALAALGLYAVVTESVGARGQELGIRTALGAAAADILTLVVSQAMRPVFIGLTIGLAAALLLVPLLKSQLVGVSPTDPVSLALAAGVLLAAAAVGCWIPARRAQRLDPIVALRHD